MPDSLLDTGVCEEVFAMLRSGQFLANPNNSDSQGIACERIGDATAALELSFSANWLMVCGEEMDDERLRLRNMLEAARSREDALALSRQCEDIGDQAEELVQAAIHGCQTDLTAWAHSIGVHFQNIVGLRLLRGVRPDSFSEQLLAVYQAGLVPCSYQGEFPDGQFIALDVESSCTKP